MAYQGGFCQRGALWVLEFVWYGYWSLSDGSLCALFIKLELCEILWCGKVVCACARAHACVHACVCVCMHACVCVCVCV